MASSIDSNCKLILYADDSAISFCYKHPDFISEKSWYCFIAMFKLGKKIECILFGLRRKITNV
jgi:hypothetical protein